MTTATPFIQNLVNEFTRSGSRDFSEQLLIFPNRRAGIFFKQALSQTLDGPVWAPSIQSIQDFVAESAPLVIPSKVSLLMELYQAYRELGVEESFDAFYAWGEILLRDFDELDKYQVDGSVLFQEILDIKEIEEAFSPDEEQSAALKQFWQNVNENRNQGEVREAFLRIWRTNRDVYHKFRERLWQQGRGYEGMAYRLLAETPEQGTYGDWASITFAGFNALSPAETAIIQHWQKQGRASIYWDGDPYYLDDTNQEAGAFMRSHFREAFQRPGAPWVQSHLRQSAKTIREYGTPLNIGQAKAMGQVLEQHAAELVPERTAVVLPDEHMLFPVLNALPEQFSEVNVTMGYPLRNTPFYSLFQNLIKMQREASGGSAEKQFYYQEVLRVLRHPYIYRLAPAVIHEEEQQIRKANEIFIPAGRLQGIAHKAPEAAAFEVLFQSIEQVGEAYEYFQQVLITLQEQLQADAMPNSRVEQEYLYHFHTLLKQLTEALQSYEVGLSLETFWRLFGQMIQQEQLPFNGEPLRGLQVMGILETRNLDFDHLYILSANEGQMPPAQQQQTFIPFTVRKAFGLPTPEDESAVFAYHFYRLLQRAETVTFLYDTESTSMEKGEKSRYLSQLELELSRTNRAITYQQEVLNPPLKQIAVQPITVEKDQKIQQTLQQYLGYNGQPPGRAFSASAVLAYLACPLQFYFKYIAGLKEPDTMQEEIAPDVMGSIFHAAVARLYNYYWQQYGAQVTSANLDELLEQIEPCLKAAFEDVFTQDLNNVQGTNQLIRDVVYRQLQSVIERDRERTPFYLKGLEKHDYTASLSLGEQDNAPYIHLKGTVDRIEADDHGNARILDYKTGNAEINEREGIPKFFENPEKNRTSIQLLWYTYLYKQSEAAADESLHPGVYPVKGTNQGIQYLRNESGLTNDQFSQMEDQLREQLQSLFDATVPFSQTADLNTCRNCAFNPICYRQHS